VPDIFDEVEEDLRAERYKRLWQRYGWVLAVAGIACIAGAGGWQYWRWQQQQAAERTAAALIEALRDPAAEAAALAAVARDGAAGPRTLARLAEAARRASTGRGADAIPLWQAVAADAQADPLYRDLAGLLLATHTLDTAPPEELAARLAPLATPANPWRHLAAEQQALLATRTGDRAGAITRLRALATDETAPAGVRARAEQMLAVLGANRPGGAS
jgi:hypothetical protein